MRGFNGCAKGISQRIQVPSTKLLASDGRRIVGIEAACQTAVAAETRTITIDTQTTDVQKVVGVAIDTTPKEDPLSSPFVGDQLGVVRVEIQQVVVVDRLVFQLRQLFFEVVAN